MNETTIGKSTRRMRSAAERANWVALFERSGKNVKTFCRENELTPSGLWAWRLQLREKAVAGSAAARLVLHSAHRGHDFPTISGGVQLRKALSGTPSSART